MTLMSAVPITRQVVVLAVVFFHASQRLSLPFHRDASHFVMDLFSENKMTKLGKLFALARHIREDGTICPVGTQPAVLQK